MGKPQRRFGKEFEAEAVRLVEVSGRTQREIAMDLGVGLSTLRRWLDKRREHEIEAPPPERQEDLAGFSLKRLRRGNEILRQERRGLHCGQPIGEHGCEDFDHLPVAVAGPGQLAPHPLQRRWQHPVLEQARRCAERPACAPEPARNATDRIWCAAPIAAWMFRHDAPVLADHDALGVGVIFRRGGRPSRSSSPSPSQRSRGSSRIDRPRPARTSAAQRHLPSRSRASRARRGAGPRRTGRRSCPKAEKT